MVAPIDACHLSSLDDIYMVNGAVLVVELSSPTINDLGELSVGAQLQGESMWTMHPRAVKAVRLVDVSPEIGYRAGQLRSAAAGSWRKHRDRTVDAVVAATALTLPTPVVVLTSDPEDLRLLLAGHDVRIEAI